MGFYLDKTSIYVDNVESRPKTFCAPTATYAELRSSSSSRADFCVSSRAYRIDVSK